MRVLIADDFGTEIHPVALVVVIEAANGGLRFDVLRDRDRLPRHRLLRTLQNVVTVVARDEDEHESSEP